jgi:hypothetical protein
MASLNELLHKIVDLHNPDRRLPLHQEVDAAVPPEEKDEEVSPNA